MAISYLYKQVHARDIISPGHKKRQMRSSHKGHRDQ